MNGPALKTWRKASGYSLRTMAQAIGVTTVTIARWERGTEPHEVFKERLRALGWKEVKNGTTSRKTATS